MYLPRDVVILMHFPEYRFRSLIAGRLAQFLHKGELRMFIALCVSWAPASDSVLTRSF